MLLRIIFLFYILIYLYVLCIFVRKKLYFINLKIDRWNRKKFLIFMINYIGIKYVI